MIDLEEAKAKAHHLRMSLTDFLNRLAELKRQAREVKENARPETPTP